MKKSSALLIPIFLVAISTYAGSWKLGDEIDPSQFEQVPTFPVLDEGTWVGILRSTKKFTAAQIDSVANAIPASRTPGERGFGTTGRVVYCVQVGQKLESGTFPQKSVSNSQLLLLK